jgi:hypothetical protein
LIAEIGLKRLIQVFHLGMSETRICLTTILTPGKQIQYFIINLIMTTWQQEITEMTCAIVKILDTFPPEA